MGQFDTILAAHGRDVTWKQRQSTETFRNGLNVFLPMDEGAGSSTHDESGKNNNGSIQGAIWADGKYGKALYFNGDTDGVVIADADSLDVAKITMCAWINPSSFNDPNNRHIIRKKAPSGRQYFLVIQATTHKIWANLSIDGAFKDAYSQSAVPLQEWTFVAATYDGAVIQVYLNGVPNGTPVPATGDIDPSTYDLLIGRYNAPPGSDPNTFHGIIDEVRVYDRALSQEEIQVLYSLGKPEGALLDKGTIKAMIQAVKKEAVLDEPNWMEFDWRVAYTSAALGFGDQLVFDGKNWDVKSSQHFEDSAIGESYYKSMVKTRRKLA